LYPVFQVCLAGREREARATLSVDMEDSKIEENIAYYRNLRDMLNAGGTIGQASGDST